MQAYVCDFTWCKKRWCIVYQYREARAYHVGQLPMQRTSAQRYLGDFCLQCSCVLYNIFHRLYNRGTSILETEYVANGVWCSIRSALLPFEVPNSFNRSKVTNNKGIKVGSAAWHAQFFKLCHVAHTLDLAFLHGTKPVWEAPSKPCTKVYASWGTLARSSGTLFA